jgi:hypothetical protein
VRTLRLRGRAIGALNLFSGVPSPLLEPDLGLGRRSPRELPASSHAGDVGGSQRRESVPNPRRSAVVLGQCEKPMMNLGDILLSIFWFMILFAWIWLLISIIGDIFRDHDLSGWGKASWTLFLI